MPAALADLVACVWWRSVASGGTTRILPDGCVDIVHRRAGGLFVAGPDTGPVEALAAGGETFVGVRFRPGCAAAALGVPADVLRDQRVDLEELWGTEAATVAARLAEAPDTAAALALLGDAVLDRLPRMAPLDSLVLAAVHRVGQPEARVAALASGLGVSERQLRRRFLAAVGYGPKTLQRVVRLRRLLATAGDRTASLARLAREAGYADQAHMTRECARLTGRTPAALLARRV